MAGSGEWRTLVKTKSPREVSESGDSRERHQQQLSTTVSLFLFVPSAWALIHQIAAVSSNLSLCGLTCERDGIYTLDKVPNVGILEYACRDKYKNFNKAYKGRARLDESSGCCIIRDAQKSDNGDYFLEFHEYGKRKQLVQTTAYVIMYPVCVTNISARHNGENVSVSVSYSGEEATVVWAWNGEALPERHQLSDSNKTLTVPSTDTGTFTALVSNPVSHSSAHYNLTLPGKEAELQSQAGTIIGIITGFLLLILK
ncbi:uncharacterized protein LOC100496031 isoform X1 [Xenopus tropicalis]|uniref:Uncharacterized protein LOC100496031 isoform X1 n=1 Tax=Xenopus tropicalis TaxID=8364 RepID=A0A8J0QXK4_XENTR|nr:uncharacterized protein LOC100496031 isoform X1 [Xenopus tropicalis]|eukprot:XP_002941705.2 PREDICTED: uncharacterized protein LOC100496031 isoform X1 [Xenopus tropicalis]